MRIAGLKGRFLPLEQGVCYSVTAEGLLEMPLALDFSSPWTRWKKQSAMAATGSSWSDAEDELERSWCKEMENE